LKLFKDLIVGFQDSGMFAKYRMEHGDEIVLANGNFPAASFSNRSTQKYNFSRTILETAFSATRCSAPMISVVSPITMIPPLFDDKIICLAEGRIAA
jgi:L-fucose mutarotase/ribose pyranase (RbsD/FucU family)